MKKIAVRASLLALLVACAPALAVDDVSATVSKEWRSYVDPLAPIAERLAGTLRHPQDAQNRRELYRNLFSQMAAGYFALLYADPQYPDFWPYFSEAMPALAPNTDNDYYVTPINEKGVYKISGFRGSVKRIAFQTGNGSFIPRGVRDKDKLGRTTAVYDADDLKKSKDGAFEVILSATRPDGYKGDWWELKPGSTNLFVRQISYDWLHEVDGRLAIERLDRAAIKPRLTAEEIDTGLKQLAIWTEETVAASIQLVDEVRIEQGINHVGYKDLTLAGAMVTQKYAYGIFDLAPDEALIIEAKVPKHCRYWNFHLLDDFGYTIDWMNRQSSVNGFMAKVDKDGVFRTVISAQDPGVPNWMDNAGYQTGAIQIRWEKCEIYPEHKTQKIKIADLRKYLPADTPVITAEAREASIRLRRKAAQMRKRW
jgi:hypothetical protein